MPRTVFAAAALLCALVVQPASASLVQAATRGAITADYTINWGLAFGGEFTAVANGADFGPGLVSGGPTFTVMSGSTYNGDFLAADNVLALFDLAAGNPVSGSFIITFDNPVQAAGAQVQASAFGGFSGMVTAYNTGGVSLGSFPVNGNNLGNGDGSAAFAGVISSALDIKRLEFTGFGDGAGINNLSVDSILLPGGTVAEPPTALTLMSLLGVFALVRRRRPGR